MDKRHLSQDAFLPFITPIFHIIYRHLFDTLYISDNRQEQARSNKFVKIFSWTTAGQEKYLFLEEERLESKMRAVSFLLLLHSVFYATALSKDGCRKVFLWFYLDFFSELSSEWLFSDTVYFNFTNFMNSLDISVLEGCKDVEGNLHKVGDSYIGQHSAFPSFQ